MFTSENFVFYCVMHNIIQLSKIILADVFVSFYSTGSKPSKVGLPAQVTAESITAGDIIGLIHLHFY